MDLTFDEAIAQYVSALERFQPGLNGHLVYEVFKIGIADVVLNCLGIPSKPSESAIPGIRMTPIGNPSVLKSGFVYLMRNQRNGFTKIGFSVQPRYREKTLQAEEPEIELLESWSGTRATEWLLHTKFAAKRVRGEWFRLDDYDVIAIRSIMTASKTQSNIRLGGLKLRMKGYEHGRIH